MILDSAHRPVPPSDISRRLKQIDPHLELMWSQDAAGGPGWWLIWRWPENDPRYRMIQNGDMPPDGNFDLFAKLPEDCPPEQAYGHAVRSFRASGHKEAKRLLDRVSEFNRQVTEAAWAPILAEAHETIEAAGSGLFGGRRVKSTKTIPRVKRGKTAKEL